MYISNDRERVLNLVTYIQWEKPQVIEYDKICNGLKALSEILSIYSYIIMYFILFLQALTLITEVFRENVKNNRLKQGLLPAIGELVYLVALQVNTTCRLQMTYADH